MSKDVQPSESLTYQNMLSEVEVIVDKLSKTDMELDDLVGEVERGFALLKGMRQRLDGTKMKVETIKKEFEEGTPTAQVTP